MTKPDLEFKVGDIVKIVEVAGYWANKEFKIAGFIEVKVGDLGEVKGFVHNSLKIKWLKSGREAIYFKYRFVKAFDHDSGASNLLKL
jgi:hypothetical protein